jgi:hypothetical protein
MESDTVIVLATSEAILVYSLEDIEEDYVVRSISPK